MSKGNTYENDWLKLIFQAVAIANIADNAASSPLTSLYVSLHSSDPGEAGDQTTNEVSYTSYARVAVARTSGGWSVSANTVSPVANIDFPACTGGSATALFWMVGTAATGAGKQLYRGAIGSALGPFTAVAATDTITLPGLSGVAVDDRISFMQDEPSGSALPGGITEGTVYFVKTVSGNEITISTTAGGSTLDITSAGDGIAFKHTPISISTGVTPRLTTSSTIKEA